MFIYYSFVSVSIFSNTFNNIVKIIVDTIATIKIPWGDNSTEVNPIFAIPKYPTYVEMNVEAIEIIKPKKPNSSNFFSSNPHWLKIFVKIALKSWPRFPFSLVVHYFFGYS